MFNLTYIHIEFVAQLIFAALFILFFIFYEAKHSTGTFVGLLGFVFMVILAMINYWIILKF